MQLNLLVIRTENIDRLAQFYAQLGIPFQRHKHGKGPYHYAAELGEVVFEIYPLLKSQPTADASLRLGFDVPNLDRLRIVYKISS